MTFSCYNCGKTSPSPIHYPCSTCGVDVSHLDGTSLSTWNQRKWGHHTALLSGSYIPLHGKDWNCSFDIVGYSKIPKIVEYTLNYGQEFTLTHRGHTNSVYLTFIPEIIGSGVSKHYATLDSHPVSGCCIISPKSVQYGHPFPILHDWVTNTFAGQTSQCRLCSEPTQLGITVCWRCYGQHGNDWTKLL